MTVAGVPRPTRVVAELLATREWQLEITFKSPPRGAAEAALAALSPVTANVTTIEFRG